MQWYNHYVYHIKDIELMGTRDKKIDAYIGKSAGFAQPILLHLRKLVHKGCPEVAETIKWGFPHFEYEGGILCSMAGFKQHCAFGFWKASIMPDPDGLLTIMGKTAMGHLGQIKSLDDLPADKVLLSYIKTAAKLNKDRVKLPAKEKPKQKGELKTPDDLMAALKKNKKALATFEAFSPSNKKDYIEWLTEAKTEETRSKRLATAIEWMNEGKIRNWKYVRK